VALGAPFNRTLVRLLPAVPRPVVRQLSSRYIAGPTLDDAVRVVRELNATGKVATIDVLGEEVRAAEEADAIARAYRDVLARIEEDGLDANVSVKLTGFGLDLDAGLCRRNVESVADAAAARGNFVRIDMEDSSTTDRTLALHRALRDSGRENVGVVVQAYLRRTWNDLQGLENVRLCKGIYVEPAELALKEFEAVRANYVRCLERLVEQGTYVGIATHDEHLVREGERIVREARLDPSR
jgi:proline dehydrogenase